MFKKQKAKRKTNKKNQKPKNPSPQIIRKIRTITKINKTILAPTHYIASNSVRVDGPILVKSNKIIIFTAIY